VPSGDVNVTGTFTQATAAIFPLLISAVCIIAYFYCISLETNEKDELKISFW